MFFAIGVVFGILRHRGGGKLPLTANSHHQNLWCRIDRGLLVHQGVGVKRFTLWNYTASIVIVHEYELLESRPLRGINRNIMAQPVYTSHKLPDLSDCPGGWRFLPEPGEPSHYFRERAEALLCDNVSRILTAPISKSTFVFREKPMYTPNVAYCFVSSD